MIKDFVDKNLTFKKLRGGRLYVFTDKGTNLKSEVTSLDIAILKGTVVDQPRNLTKPVTVE